MQALTNRYAAARRNAALLGALQEEHDGGAAASAAKHKVAAAGTVRKAQRVMAAKVASRASKSGDQGVQQWRDSRIGRAFQEHGKQADWISKVLLRNFMAAVIQVRLWRASTWRHCAGTYLQAQALPVCHSAGAPPSRQGVAGAAVRLCGYEVPPAGQQYG